ncbi:MULTISPECIES: TetR/AcrR family transcriptional regulator [Pseudonocardia]|uniref:TetR family transcriptional regulator n=1 Tax=Pseudonocardia alni TaxID=33907 RepID=A0AA44UND3_PSEA5|nr:TetR/AcrR family transcriptional regulator [Pseudonocardia alni]OJG04705.1 HTH-type transcriptional repressor KstR [Pseudonocardia autotrophica]PKB30320.1 TetR family transcriptional regulator [Pseudonocardia alni]
MGVQREPVRSDARRSRAALLEAAAAEFVTAGVDAPVRAIAARAGVGVGTVYRHFPTRPDLVVAVYRHQVEGCAAAARTCLDAGPTPFDALVAWVGEFVDLLVTKHGLVAMLVHDDGRSAALHELFLERLLPAGEEIVRAAREAGQLPSDVTAYEVLRGIGNLCFGAEADSAYDARRAVGFFLAGLRVA